MSGGTFTDENGQVYVVDPHTGQLTPARGSKKKPPGLEELAKPAVDEALKTSGKALGKAAAGKIGAAIGLNSLAGSGGGEAVAQAASTGAFPVGTAANGGTMMSDGSVVGSLAGEGATSFFTGNSLLGEGAMGMGDYIPGVAGAIALGDLYMNRPENIGHGSGYVQGALGGAGVGWTVGGPVGAGVGAGLGLLANAFGWGGESRTKGEEKQREALAEQGIIIPNSDVKEWELNEKFKDSRKESDLLGKDIIHASDFYTINGYGDLDAAKQEAIANKALELGLIQEKLGKINVGRNAEFDEFLKSQFPGAPSGGGVSREAVAEAKRNRRRAAVAQILPELNAPVTQGPRYDINPSDLIKNPYL